MSAYRTMRSRGSTRSGWAKNPASRKAMVTPRPRNSSGAPMRNGVGRMGIGSAGIEWRRKDSRALPKRRAQSRQRSRRGSQPGVFAVTRETRSGSTSSVPTRSSSDMERWQIGQWKGRSSVSAESAGVEAERGVMVKRADYDLPRRGVKSLVRSRARYDRQGGGDDVQDRQSRSQGEHVPRRGPRGGRGRHDRAGDGEQDRPLALDP